MIRPGNQPLTDIVIPSLNSPLIGRIIEAIKSQDSYQAVRHIIVIGLDERGLVKNDDLVNFIDTRDPVPPGVARNIGIKASTGSLIIFLDSDCVPKEDWLSQHLFAHQAGHKVVSGGVEASGNNYWNLSYNLSMFHPYLANVKPGARRYLPTLNLSVDRTVIDAVGLLDESLPRSQDMEWTTRMGEAGFTPYFWPAATIRHEHNRNTFSLLWKDCARSGQYAREVRLRHRGTLDTPVFLRNRRLTLILSPIIATGVVLQAIRNAPSVMLRNWMTLPAIYISKIAWCYGASKPDE